MTNDLVRTTGLPFRQNFDLRAALLAIATCGTVCPAYAQVAETVLYDFTGGKDGAFPQGTPLADLAGPSHTLRRLYGTASGGGGADCYNGCGTAFELTPPKGMQPGWSEKTKWLFTGGNDGSFPLTAGLAAATRRFSPDSPLYGTTWVGGSSGNGTVFSLAGNALTTIWTFTGGNDGANPANGQVVIDGAGNVYAFGGDGGGTGNGTVIELTPPVQGQPAWTETTIWTFSGGNDGAFPTGVILDKSGALYVTAAGGGSTANGAIIKLIPPAQGQTVWTEQTLWSFQGGSDGAGPQGPVTMGRDGALYGTTNFGGIAQGCNGCGTVFRLVPPRRGQMAWTEAVLWSFTYGADGGNPYDSVILDRAGAVYGTAAFGAINNNGTVFKLTPPGQNETAWNETTLWSFTGGSDGGVPIAALTADGAGTIYGFANNGGLTSSCSGYGCGVAFSLTGTGYVP